MTPSTLIRPHPRSSKPAQAVTGFQLVESTLGFIEKLQTDDPTLHIVVSGTGCIMALLWARALEDSSPPGSHLQKSLMDASTHTLEESHAGFTAGIHVYVWPKGKSDEHWDEVDQLVKGTLMDGKVDGKTGDIIGMYPRESKAFGTEIQVTVAKCPDSNTRLSLKGTSHSKTIKLNLANPAPCIVRNLARLATGNWRGDAEHHLRITPEWSTLVLFSRIISTFESLNHPLPKAFDTKEPTRMHELVRRFVRDWTSKQVCDETNENPIRDTCRVLSRYLHEPSSEGTDSTKSSQINTASSAFAPTSRRSTESHKDQTSDALPLYRRIANMMP